MNKKEIQKIIKSTIQLVNIDPISKLPKGIGSGCIITYQNKKILLTVAHVTDRDNSATCVDTGKPTINGQTELYYPGSMNYFDKYDMTMFEQQIELLKTNPERKETIDFGKIDFSFEVLRHKPEFVQIPLEFEGFTVAKSKKIIINADLTHKPKEDDEYGFFGCIKPMIFEGTPMGTVFERQPVYHGGLKFIQKINHFYEFELPSPINDNTDFKGTSGAPIMDKDGKLVSLITHGYEGATKIYGIALADMKSLVDAILLSDES